MYTGTSLQESEHKMHIEVIRQSPLRSPRWRQQRVMQMLRARPTILKLTRFDDVFIRRYYCLLRDLIANRHDPDRALIGCDKKREDALSAHQIFYSPDYERRQMFEAYLLTELDFPAIADCVGTTPEVIEFFSQVFFDVRERFTRKAWIYKAIRDDFDPCNSSELETLPGAEQGYILRWFAYHGGSLVLQSLLRASAGLPRPETAEGLVAWEEAVFSQVVGARAVAVALSFNGRNPLRLIKLALKNRPVQSAAQGSDRDWDVWADKVLSAVETSLSAHKFRPPKALPPEDGMPCEASPTVAQPESIVAHRYPWDAP